MCIRNLVFLLKKLSSKTKGFFFFLKMWHSLTLTKTKSFMAVEGVYLRATSINSTLKIILATRRTAEIARKRQANRPYVFSTMTTRIFDCQNLFAFDYYVLPYPLCSPHNRKVLLLFFFAQKYLSE